MLFFLDTASTDEIKKALPTGMIDGVTTNPSLNVRCGKKFHDVIQEICCLISGPVSVEVTCHDKEGMVLQAKQIAGLAPNIVVKIPLTKEGLEVCYTLREEGIPVNVTLCFSANQALMAAKAGATYISPFIGRLEDSGCDGKSLIKEIRTLYDNYDGFSTQILAASIRHPRHVFAAAQAGSDIVTLPPKILYQLYDHNLTTKGIEGFEREWAEYEKGCLTFNMANAIE
jgi:transaldolase